MRWREIALRLAGILVCSAVSHGIPRRRAVCEMLEAIGVGAAQRMLRRGEYREAWKSKYEPSRNGNGIAKGNGHE